MHRWRGEMPNAAADFADDADECQPFMMKRVKLIGLILVAVHVLSYLFLSDQMLERKACDKYVQFTERRFTNKDNKNVSEGIYISSCGDEFFRDTSPLEEVARGSNPTYRSFQLNDAWQFTDGEGNGGEFYQSVSFEGYPMDDILGTIRLTTDTLQTRNCIVFELCSVRSIPFLYKQVSYRYIYSSFPTDFHILRYTDRMLGSEPIYVWLLFTWVEFRGSLGNIW